MDKSLPSFLKLNMITISFFIFSLFFLILLMAFFFDHSGFPLKNVSYNFAWADVDPNQDTDGDGISNKLERENDPNRDTDNDGIKDFLDQDTCTMPTATANGSISLQLWLFDYDANRIIEDQNIISFSRCSTLGFEDIDLPPTFGEFPYGLWRFQVNLPQGFKHEDYGISMEIYFPGQTNPLNSEYWVKEYKTNKVEWVEFKSKGLYVSDIQKRSGEVRLADTRSDSNLDIIPGFGDQDPNEFIIEHVGGLLWPIPVGERCFIGYSWSYGEGSREKIFLKHAPITLNFLKSLDLFSSSI